MAKKKGRFGKFLGALTGTPYDRLLKQVENITDSHEGDRELSRAVKRMVGTVTNAYKDDRIDDDEHDILMEELEDIDPDGRTFNRMSDEEEYYSGEGVPDAPTLKTGRNVNLDDLMKKKTGSFTGSFGKEEFEEYREKMARDFVEESREAANEGYQQRSGSDPTGRVFRDDEEEALETKRRIAVESGLIDNEAEGDDEDYFVDDDGIEWFRDEGGDWWYREPEQTEWMPSD